MANRDDYRGHRGGGREPWRQEGQRPQGGRSEQRSFGEEGRFNSDEARYGPRGGVGDGEQEPWRRDRYGSRFDQDRADYGSGYDPNRGEYGRGQAEQASQFGANYGGGYGGQEYGVEGHGGGNRQGEQYGAPQDYRNRQRPQQSQQQANHEFDTDYVHWREEQLRIHDRDYQDWRRHQQEQHDEEYRKFRTERRDTFGRNFLDWRSQRNASPGATQPQTTAQAQDFHSREPVSLSGGRPGSQAAGAQAGSDFAKAPSAVQAAADGSAARSDDGDKSDKKNERH